MTSPELKPAALWLTGISGAGKSTIADALNRILEKNSNKIIILDGDVVRDFFENDLGMSREDRISNVKRIAFAASLLVEAGVFVIVANIAPYYEVRDFIRRKIKNYMQVYLDVPLEVVKKRDVKGLYHKFERGEIKNIVGLDDSYDIPRNPDLVLKTSEYNVDIAVDKILQLLDKRGFYNRASS